MYASCACITCIYLLTHHSYSPWWHVYLIYNYSYEAMEVHSPGTFWHSKFSLPADHNIHSSLWSTERNLTQNHLKICARYGVNEEDTLVISGPSKGNIRVLSGKPMKNSQSLRPTARHILSQTLEVTVKQIYDLILTFTDSSTAWSVTTCPTYLSERCRLPCHCRTGHLRWLDISESLPAMTTIASQGSLECSCAIEMQHFRPKTWQSEWLQNYKIKQKHKNNLWNIFHQSLQLAALKAVSGPLFWSAYMHNIECKDKWPLILLHADLVPKTIFP